MPAHPAQHAVAAGLKRGMEMWRASLRNAAISPPAVVHPSVASTDDNRNWHLASAPTRTRTPASQPSLIPPPLIPLILLHPPIPPYAPRQHDLLGALRQEPARRRGPPPGGPILPRATTVAQNVQRSSHPSWTLSDARVPRANRRSSPTRDGGTGSRSAASTHRARRRPAPRPPPAARPTCRRPPPPRIPSRPCGYLAAGAPGAGRAPASSPRPRA
jgi:hypothetical protein